MAKRPTPISTDVHPTMPSQTVCHHVPPCMRLRSPAALPIREANENFLAFIIVRDQAELVSCLLHII